MKHSLLYLVFCEFRLCPPPILGNSLYTYVSDSLSKWNKIIENKPPIVQTVSLCMKNWSRLTSSSPKSTVTQVIVIWSGLYHTKIGCIIWYPEKKKHISWVSIFSFKAQYSSFWFGGGGGGFWVLGVWVFFCFLVFFEGRRACLQKFCSCLIFTHILDLIENWHKFSSKGKNVFIKKKWTVIVL